MNKKNNAENADSKRLHELEKAEIQKEKASRPKIHIQNRTVLVAVTGGLCLITVFLGVYTANKLASDNNSGQGSSLYSQPPESSAFLNASSGNQPAFAENDNSDVSPQTNPQNASASNSNPNSASNQGSGIGIPSAGGVGNVPFPPSGQVSGAVLPNASESDPNAHLPDVVDTQTPDASDPELPSENSENNGGQSRTEGRSPFDDMPFFNHGGGGSEAAGMVDEPISDTGITGEGFFH